MEFDEFVVQLSEKREELYNAFEARKLHLVEARNKRATALMNAADRILKGIKTRADNLKTINEINGYFAADLMIDTGAIFVPTRFVVDQLLHMEAILPRYAYEKGLIVADAHTMAMKIAVAKGVKIAMGTDIFVSGDMYGQNSLEIKLLQDAGMTALEAIEAATANGPDTLGPQAPLSGQLVERYDADVIAIDFNPLEDNSGWGNPDRVTHVWKSGNSVKVAV